ncbi:hypothetical protein TanjilG_15050 [Lupinus angustifolius]|uniref:Bifunctional inhibitor/plant lipid transfer protein/seed storage helical domain-containing protein n=1 Tax=Lupinus angustifolius TaxID=3871 RepID=A0A1J7I3C5_LUPAN|nr:PREDICTED: non-specific lipid-transfer protein A-like [Lupinus angustifolius]OIW13146.1 hypothetical protein TanjilG_15050 [Lupinus angustifolius]
MKNVLAAFLTFIAILLVIVEPGHSFNFDDGATQLLPCTTYNIGTSGDTPSTECCNGARTLQSSTPTTDDKREACEFLKAVASSIPLIKEDKASSLFKKCGVNVPYSFSKDGNCET